MDWGESTSRRARSKLRRQALRPSWLESLESCALMQIQPWNLVFLIGFVVYVGIRGVFRKRTKCNEVAGTPPRAPGKAPLVIFISGGRLLPGGSSFSPGRTFFAF